MDVDFVIPLSKDDLLSGEAGSYVVDEIVSARVLPNKLRGKRILGLASEHKCYALLGLLVVYILIFTLSDCLADLRSGGPIVILENFDCFFSLLRSVLNLEI